MIKLKVKKAVNKIWRELTVIIMRDKPDPNDWDKEDLQILGIAWKECGEEFMTKQMDKYLISDEEYMKRHPKDTLKETE